MHDVRVALHVHEIFHLDRTILAHPPKIVAPKIDQHDVLGAFFLIGAHLLLQTQVFGLIAAARMGACDGTVFQLASSHAHQHLRR